MSIFSTMLELHFSGLKSILFYPDDQKMFLPGFLCSKNRWANGPFFEKNHGPTPLQNVHFLKFFRTYLLWSEKHSFLSRISKIFLSAFCCSKQNIWEKGQFFEKNHWLTLRKMSIFLTLLEFHFSGLKSILYYPEYKKMFLSGFFG